MVPYHHPFHMRIATELIGVGCPASWLYAHCMCVCCGSMLGSVAIASAKIILSNECVNITIISVCWLSAFCIFRWMWVDVGLAKIRGKCIDTIIMKILRLKAISSALGALKRGTQVLSDLLLFHH